METHKSKRQVERVVDAADFGGSGLYEIQPTFEGNIGQSRLNSQLQGSREAVGGYSVEGMGTDSDTVRTYH